MGDPSWCPELRPTRSEFSRPFAQYVEEAFKAYPDAPMLKIVPPKGWTPRTEPFPHLRTLRISTPIKQHVFGTKGAYRCLLEEQRGVTVADFKKLAYRDDHATPRKGHKQDALLERAFWSSITLSPPYYGADTPCSFFDDDLRFGWNLRKLDSLLSHSDMPVIPGVTTPMTYFGMWKSFFSWHIEDVDLYSINYLHFGAPKVWYCVSPGDRLKFENMAGQLFPELARSCKAFLRHKDILISPRVLRAFNVPFQQAHQEAGEFVVLNAAAYHSGFNQGFNCAEAVNFALPDWLPLGRKATRCTCSALDEAVRLNMSMFRPEGEVWSEEEEDSSSGDEDEEEGEEEATPTSSSSQQDSINSGSEASSSGAADSDSSSETDSGHSSQTNASERHTSAATGSPAAARRAAAAKLAAPPRRRKQQLKPLNAVKSRVAKPSRSKSAAKAALKHVPCPADLCDGVDMAALNALMPSKMGRPFKSAENAVRASGKLVALALAVVADAEADVRRYHRPVKNPELQEAATRRRAAALTEARTKLQQAKQFAHAASVAAASAAAYRTAHGCDDIKALLLRPPPKRTITSGRPTAVSPARPRVTATSSARLRVTAPQPDSHTRTSPKRGWVRKVSLSSKPSKEQSSRGRRIASYGKRRDIVVAVPSRPSAEEQEPPPPQQQQQQQQRCNDDWMDSHPDRPMVIVGQDDAAASKYFYMVQRVAGSRATAAGVAQLHWLAEGKDGLYRPTAAIYQEKLGALIPVETEWRPNRGRREAGYKLLTPRSLILDTQLVD